MFKRQRRALVLSAFFSTIAAASVPALPFVDDEDEEAEESEEEEDDSPAWFAVRGGDVYTGTGGLLRGATILAKNGKIEEIGYDLYVPEDAVVVDATGRRVYPGLVAIDASSRVVEGTVPGPAREEALEFGDDGHDHGMEFEAEEEPELPYQLDQELFEEPEVHLLDHDEELAAAFEAAGGTLDVDAAADFLGAGADLGDEFDPFNYNLVLTLAAGITTVGQSKGVVKLKRNEIEDVVMADRKLVSLSWSSGRSKQSLREKFEGAARYVREMRTWEEEKKKNKDLPEPSRKGVDSTALKILSGEAFAKFGNSGRNDLLEIARLAQTYGFRPVFEDCIEGWTIASELGRAGAYAIVTPRTRVAKDERLQREGGSSIENAALLYDHGVQVALIPGDKSIDLMGLAGRDLMHLPIEAAFAVRGGLPEDAAIAGITSVPARLLGVDHRVGTLEVGKDCDLILTDGDLLHYETFVHVTVVEGKVVYEKDAEPYWSRIPDLAPEKAE